MPHPIVVVLFAFGVLILLAVGGLLWVKISTQYTISQTFFWLLAHFYARILWRTKIEGEFPIQGEGNAVIICNHRSSIDPFFVQIALRRVVHWMVAREYCEHPILGFFLRIAEVIPVNRGGIDTASTKAAIRYALNGGIVGMLPEGRINTTDEFMLPVRPGAIVVALKTNAPIVPCYIEGAPYRGTPWSPFLMRAHARVRYGQPIDLSPYSGREKDGELVRDLLVQCVKAIATLAGQPDFEPRLAGRRWKPGAEESPEPDATQDPSEGEQLHE